MRSESSKIRRTAQPPAEAWNRPCRPFCPFRSHAVLRSVLAAKLAVVAPLGWQLAEPLFVCCSAEVLVGNVYALFAAVMVVGLSRPAVWAFPVLTKVTPGLGPVWFLARGEFRKAGRGVAATVAIAVTSYAIDPGAWVAWVRFLLAHDGQGSLGPPVRAALATGLTVYAARADRPRLLPLAMLIALPIIQGPTVLAVFAAVPRLPARRPVVERDVVPRPALQET